MEREVTIMHGTMNITSDGTLRIHTYTAPDDGWGVNSHIIEFATQTIVIDAQYTLVYGRDVVDYANSLGKPMSRLYVTHYHPDHLLGAAAFPVPIHALQEVKKKIDAVGDRVAREEHEKFPATIPTHAEKPSLIVTPSCEIIDGVKIEFLLLQHAETEDALMIGFPDAGILITQDLIYHDIHVFLGEQALDTWLEALADYQSLPYRRILPGHGAPGGLELYDGMRHYLTTAREMLAASRDAADFRARMIAAFPAFGGHALLDHEMRFLFPQHKEAKA
jgi:glyoxylase-like metal-dependent hydrolase (beta-lactamase superfamily II)